MAKNALVPSLVLLGGVLLSVAFANPTSTALQQQPLVKEERHLQQSSCSKLQHEVQKAIIVHKWGLDNLKFQQRLKRHPKYIVTIQHVKSVHEPIVELRCPSSPLDNFEFLFHESRFSAESVRLFDIHSIFPIHSGSLSIKLKLDNLVVKLDRGSDIGLSIKEMFFEEGGEGVSWGKEHREEDNLVDLEKEIEGVFIRRVQPSVQSQISKLVATTVKQFLDSNLVTF